MLRNTHRVNASNDGFTHFILFPSLHHGLCCLHSIVSLLGVAVLPRVPGHELKEVLADPVGGEEKRHAAQSGAVKRQRGSAGKQGKEVEMSGHRSIWF